MNYSGFGDTGQHWDPKGGPDGTGGWALPSNTPGPTTPQRSFVGGAWGGQGNDVRPDGSSVPGTSGAARDAARFGQMGQTPLYDSGPQIHRFDSDESRGIQMDAIGMLRDRATGAETPAQRLAKQQTAGAVAGVQSGAASIKGGAMARAAAGRGAMATGARVQAQGAQDVAALKAREQADAAGQFFGAASGQRAGDLGVATSQAQLDEAQRAQNDQREGFYEKLGYDTKNAELGHQLGRTAADNAAANQAHATGMAADAADQARTDRNINAGVGGVLGGAKAYDLATQDPAPKPKYDPNSTSDPHAKRAIRPVSDAEARRLKKQGDAMIAQTKANAAAPPMFGRGSDYDGKYLPSPFADPKPASAPGLHEAIERQIAEDKASEPRYGYFDEEEGGSRRALAQHDDPYVSKRGGLSEREDPYGDRDTMTSDPRAKREAFIAGANHSLNMGGESAPELPDYMKDGPSAEQIKNAEDKSNAYNDRKDNTSPHAFDRPVRGATGTGMTGPRGKASATVGKAAGAVFGRAVPQPAPLPAITEEQVRRDFVPPPVAPKLDATGAPMADYAYSDPKTKEDVHRFGSPMASANRSMAPSSYEYKPEFLPPEQKLGEKNVGPMANKMEADPIAGTAIVKDPRTGLLAIDKTKGLKLVMGGLASLQKQVDQMGGRRA